MAGGAIFAIEEMLCRAVLDQVKVIVPPVMGGVADRAWNEDSDSTDTGSVDLSWLSLFEAFLARCVLDCRMRLSNALQVLSFSGYQCQA